MPYIKQERRNEIDEIVIRAEDLFDVGRELESPGDLNFALTEIISGFLKASGNPIHYQLINDIMGALEGAKVEFYRRVAAPYEDKKIAENGDVYPA